MTNDPWRAVMHRWPPPCRFLGANSAPPSILLYENGDISRPLYDNAAQRDWGLVNGAFQPTIRLEEAT